MVRPAADWVARRPRLPTSLRAVAGYYAATGIFDYESLRVKRRVDTTVSEMVDETFAAIEAAIAEEFGYGYVEFSYDTKLLLPAKLTLGYLYRTLEPRQHDRAESMTHLAIEALLDGDMRDARNDGEFEDFQVDFSTTESDRRVIAHLAQELLQARVEEKLVAFPDQTRETYEWAVEVSERHQSADERFRELLTAAETGEPGALDAIRAEYRSPPLAEPRASVSGDDGLPYLKTQYERVGIIYDAMLEMYRDVGFPIPEPFQRAIVLAIVGAQIWLDDIEDYAADVEAGQLTPVTAEYLLADSEEAAQDAVVDVCHAYLDRAREAATEVDSALTGVAVEYILRAGEPERLPDG